MLTGVCRTHAGPMRDPGKHLFSLCLFCLFVCGATLHKIRNVAAQLHKRHLLLLLCVARKEEEEEGDGIAFFFFFFVQHKKLQRRRLCCCRLLLHVVELLQRSSAAPCYGAVAAQLPAATLLLRCNATP